MSAATAGAHLNKTKKEGEELLNKFFTQFSKVKEAIDTSKQFLKENGYVEDWAGRRRHLPEINFPAATARYRDKVFDGFNPILGCKDVEKTEQNDPYLASWANKITKQTRNDEANKIVQEAFKANPSVILSLHTGQVAQAERQCFNARIQSGGASLTKLAMINIDRDPFMIEHDAHLVATVHDEVLLECPALYSEAVGKRLSQIMINTAKPYINVPMKCDEVVVPRWYCDEMAAAIKKEYKELGENGKTSQEAREIIFKNHTEYDKEVIEAVLNNEKDILDF